MRVALYARYSSDQQREASIDGHSGKSTRQLTAIFEREGDQSATLCREVAFRVNAGRQTRHRTIVAEPMRRYQRGGRAAY